MTKKRFDLEIVDADPPSIAYTEDGQLLVDLDMKDAFHHGYIDIHKRPPPPGTNPLFGEYLPLMKKGSRDFLWADDNWSTGDHRSSESHRMGRIIGRAYLSQGHGYRWFVDIKDLMASPYKQWTAKARRRSKGHKANLAPDVLAIKPGPGGAAVAEFKGTKNHVTRTSPILEKEWRIQAGHVRIFKRDEARKVKTWIVASCWSSSESSKRRSKIYAEDPAGDDLSPEETSDLEYWLSTMHTSRNLERIGYGDVATSLHANLAGIPRTQHQLTAWKPRLHGMSQMRFIGTIVPDNTADMWSIMPPLFSRLSNPYFESWARRSFARSWFDGLWLDAPQNLLDNQIPGAIPLDNDLITNLPENVSLLPDGSFIAPAELMEPAETITV